MRERASKHDADKEFLKSQIQCLRSETNWKFLAEGGDIRGQEKILSDQNS